MWRGRENGRGAICAPAHFWAVDSHPSSSLRMDNDDAVVFSFGQSQGTEALLFLRAALVQKEKTTPRKKPEKRPFFRPPSTPSIDPYLASISSSSAFGWGCL